MPTDFFSTEEERGWTLADVYDDLAGREDLIVYLNVTDSRLRKWLEKREHFKTPLPIKRIGHIDIYSKQEWRDWLDRWEESRQNNKQVTNAKRPLGDCGDPSFWSFFGGELAEDETNEGLVE